MSEGRRCTGWRPATCWAGPTPEVFWGSALYTCMHAVVIISSARSGDVNAAAVSGPDTQLKRDNESTPSVLSSCFFPVPFVFECLLDTGVLEGLHIKTLSSSDRSKPALLLILSEKFSKTWELYHIDPCSVANPPACSGRRKTPMMLSP